MITRVGKGKIGSLWIATLLIAVVAAIPRFYWMLTGAYNAVIIIFILFALLPFLMLTREARFEIGFRKCSLKWIVMAFIVGVAISAVVYASAYLLYEHSNLNWYVVVMNTFDRNGIIDQIRPNPLLFVAFSLPVMIFSPIGEEFFFRGLLHESLAARFSSRVALITDAVFFGVTHLAHYGLLLTSDGVQLLPSAFLWMALMGACAIRFYQMKHRSGSIWGAVICHSGFNFAMMFIIFYVIR
jgi:membrane protease YdiL (CAAX protease family)